MGRNADSINTAEQTTQSFHLRGQSVIVPKADLLHSNGVILIDNGNRIIFQQLLESIASIQVWPSVAQVVQCQQYLSTRLQASASASQALTEDMAMHAAPNRVVRQPMHLTSPRAAKKSW